MTYLRTLTPTSCWKPWQKNQDLEHAAWKENLYRKFGEEKWIRNWTDHIIVCLHVCIKFWFEIKLKLFCAPGTFPVRQLRMSGQSRKSLKVWRTCSTKATGPWRIPLPCVSAAVEDARGCFQSVPLVPADFHHHRSVTPNNEIVST